MARGIARADIWMYRFAPPDKRRPVLILSRPSVLGVLQTATVIALSSTGHGSALEVELGEAEGLKHVSFANAANIFTVRQRDLVKYLGTADTETMKAVCAALAIAAGCD